MCERLMPCVRHPGLDVRLVGDGERPRCWAGRRCGRVPSRERTVAHARRAIVSRHAHGCVVIVLAAGATGLHRHVCGECGEAELDTKGRLQKRDAEIRNYVQ